MSFRTAFLAALTAALPFLAHAGVYDWDGHGRIAVEIPEQWEFNGRSEGGLGYSFRGRPGSDAAAAIQITLIQAPESKPIRDDELPDRLRDSLGQAIEQSVEKKFQPVPLKCRQGKGWYAELTDASLVGKPAVPNDFKVMRVALVALDRRYLVIAAMHFDNPQGKEVSEMLAMVASITLQKDPTSSSGITVAVPTLNAHSVATQ